MALSIHYRMHIDDFQQRFNSRDFAELIAFNNIHPFLIDRAELATATLSALVANALSKNGNFKPSDFMVQSKERKTDWQSTELEFSRIYGRNNNP